MSTIQKIFRFFMSDESFKKAEKESKKWKFVCECGQTFSVWDIGGIRYKARGNPSKAARCPACSTVTVRKLRKD